MIGQGRDLEVIFALALQGGSIGLTSHLVRRLPVIVIAWLLFTLNLTKVPVNPLIGDFRPLWQIFE